MLLNVGGRLRRDAPAPVDFRAGGDELTQGASGVFPPWRQVEQCPVLGPGQEGIEDLFEVPRGVRVLVGAVVLGGPIAVSAGAIWASESLPITVLIGRDSSRPPQTGGCPTDC